MPLIHIPRRNTRFGGTVSVGVNGRISKVPVGQDYAASDGEYDALIAAGVPVQQMTIPAGMIAIPPFMYGNRVNIGVNGVIMTLPTGRPFVATADQIAALAAIGIAYMGAALAILFADGTPWRWADGTISEWTV